MLGPVLVILLGTRVLHKNNYPFALTLTPVPLPQGYRVYINHL
jgi:hypothetical protein